MVTALSVVKGFSGRMVAGVSMVSFKAAHVLKRVRPYWRTIMLLYFRAKLEQLNMSYHQFFETAYQWRFNPPQMPSLNDDYAQFLLHAVLPKYVVEYLNHLQKEETCTAPDAAVPCATSQR